MRMRKSKHRAGFSLLEVLISMAILGIGAALSLKLIGVFINTNKSLASNHEALTLASRLMAEVMNAPFRSTVDFDAGLAVSNAPYTTPVIASAIQSVGEFPASSYLTTAAGGQGPAKFVTRYLVSDCPTCTAPIPGNAALVGPGGIDIIIEVANARVGGPLLRPIRMAARRTYSHALNCSTVPPGTPCIGRAF